MKYEVFTNTLKISNIMSKKIHIIIAAILINTTIWAQSPEKMSCQAVVRDASDKLVTSQQIGMQISILQGSADGTVVYTETQTPTTNANGLVSIEIGGKTGFDVIDWANSTYFIKSEIDPAGGTTYTITGTSQLLSVPYALHAKTAKNVTGTITETDPVYSTSQAANITATDINNLGNLSGTNTGDQDLSSLANKTALGDSMALVRSEIPDVSSFISNETDPVFGVSVAIGITAVDTANWNNNIVDTHIDSAGVAAYGFVAGPHTVDTHIDSTGVTALGFVAGAHAVDTDTHIDSTGIAALGFTAGPHTIDTDTQLDSAGVVALGFVAGDHTIDTDTHIDSTGVAAYGFVAGPHTADTHIDSTGIATMGFVAGPHTIDTDTHIDSTGVAALGFVAGAHTIDTDTHIDSTGVASYGFVAGPHTVDTHIDSTGVIALGFVAGPHTVDTDTHIDSTGIATLGFTAGSHTIDTDTQLDSTGVAALGFVAGPHTIDTDTHIDSAGVAVLGFVAGPHTVDTDDQVAAEVNYNNSTSGLTATNVQAAIDELENEFSTSNNWTLDNGSLYRINTAGSDTLVTILNNGNVGIGNISPTAKLDVTGAYNAPQFRVGNVDGHGIFFEADGSSAHYNWLVGQQKNADDALEFTPSTSAGGTTFTNPTMVLKRDGYVGIGTETPNSLLELYNHSSVAAGLRLSHYYTGAAGTAGKIDFFNNYRSTTNSKASIQCVYSSYWDSELQFLTTTSSSAPSVKMVIEHNGNVGIGTTNASRAKLVVNGSVTYSNGTYGYLNSGGGTGFYSTASSSTTSIWASGRVVSSEFNAVSDRRIKNTITQVNDAVSSLMKLNVVAYNKATKSGANMGEIGLIAQEVKKVVPLAVRISEGDVLNEKGEWIVVDDFHQLNYQTISMLGIKAIQEQQILIKALQEKVKAQEQLLKSQQEQIDLILKKMNK